ncbi:MAG: hypothetical protein RQ714_07485 [Nitrosomonas sp.]|nr:hypothetical protein [Nitrosomonas sp.]
MAASVNPSKIKRIISPSDFNNQTLQFRYKITAKLLQSTPSETQARAFARMSSTLDGLGKTSRLEE